jgi:hypothetical protein
MPNPPIEIADVFRMGFSAHNAARGPYPGHYYKTVNALLACHTAALGGHVYRCDSCGHDKISYNSCRNRHCPSCQAAVRAQWVDNRTAELLPVPYFHVVFTVPSELNAFALRNKAVFYNILFKAASHALQTLARDPRHIGAQLGFLAVLHTWGQNLLDHPHIHCVVPAGGLSPDGLRWKKAPYGKSFLLPVKPLAALFRGKFLDLFNAAVAQKSMLFHGFLEKFTAPGAFNNLLRELYRTDWVVYAKPPFAGPKAVLKYLGRYTHRIAIANSRIISLSKTHVSFSWKDYRDKNKQKIMTLEIGEFIRRFLLHIVPTGFVRIRYFGFLAQSAKKNKLSRCRNLLGVKERKPLPAAIDKKAFADLVADICGYSRWQCPLCHTGRLRPRFIIPKPHRKGPLSAAA